MQNVSAVAWAMTGCCLATAQWHIVIPFGSFSGVTKVCRMLCIHEPSLMSVADAFRLHDLHAFKTMLRDVGL